MRLASRTLTAAPLQRIANLEAFGLTWDDVDFAVDLSRSSRSPLVPAGGTVEPHLTLGAVISEAPEVKLQLPARISGSSCQECPTPRQLPHISVLI